MSSLRKLLLGFGIPSLLVGFASMGRAAELTKVNVALSAFQDVNTIYVGIVEGFYAKEGIELDIQNTDWPGANELLMGGHVDLATSCDADVTLQNARNVDTTLAFPLYYFAGGGLTFDPKKHNWKTLDAVLPTVGNDMTAAIRDVLVQAKGMRVGVSAGGAEYASFIQMLTVAGLKPRDYTIVDLAQEDLPPALLSGSIDIMISGIPQRLAVIKQGYATLMDQSAVPSTVAHCGFGASRAWVDSHIDLAVRIEKVILETLAFIETHPDQSFQIISDKMRQEGTAVAPDDLKRVWNVMEFFPNGKSWYETKVVSLSGQFYWKDRFDRVVKNLEAQKRITGLDTSLENLNYGLKIVAAVKGVP